MRLLCAAALTSIITAAWVSPTLEAGQPAPGDLTRSVPAVICQVFGPRYCGEAKRVAWCESRWSTTAQNGQYLGIFQMGSWERRTYGHGSGAWAQSRAALRYFRASGRDWSPWSCRWAA